MARRRTARVATGVLEGIDGVAVTAEIDITRGLPGFHLVGLPNAEVRESRERVLSALRNSGLKPPLGRITVNLAPAGVRKTGASCDLGVALGVLAAGRVIRAGPAVRTRAAFVGELSLFGEVRPVRGLLPMVMELAQRGARAVVVPRDQLAEARLVAGVQAVGVGSLAQAVDWWQGRAVPQPPDPRGRGGDRDDPDELLWPDLAGQPEVRKAATIAAAGRHHCLLVGPPGTGKTRLARRLGVWAGSLGPDEALEVTRIHSATGTAPVAGLMTRRPFRAPHHTLTRAGLVGGGVSLRPGEVTLAHLGVLFLDEVSEFAPAVLDGLREPLSEGRVTVVRHGGARTYPADFQLVAAMNPCRCGHLGSASRPCTCQPAEIRRHRSRLSGPLLDRIEIFVEVAGWEGAFTPGEQGADPGPGAGWREAPRRADLERARERLAVGPRPAPDAAAAAFLERARRSLALSLRAVDRCLAVAGTVAALDGRDVVGAADVREALAFRRDGGEA